MDQTNEPRNPAPVPTVPGGAGARAGLSIVVPLYNEGTGLERLHACLTDVARRRHGDLAVLRTLARRERSIDGVFPVF